MGCWYVNENRAPCKLGFLPGDTCTVAVGVSVSVIIVVSFSMGVLAASVLCYISRRSKESSHKPSPHADPANEMKGDVMEMGTNTAYGSHVSPTAYEEVGTN